MKAFALAAVLGLAVSPLFGDSKESKEKSAPAYDTATVVDVSGEVTEVRDIPSGSPIAGVNLTIKVKGEPVAVYVAPTEFVKLFDVKFAKGDEVQVVGSKVKFEGADLILAREIRLGHTTLVVRDKDGSPYWKYFLKTIPTGL